jgi:hypothetical protein
MSEQPIGPETSSNGGKMASLSDNQGDKGAARAGLIGINNLNYRLEPDMSVAVNCTDKNHFFQQQQYTNSQRAVCVLNSGADYIDPRRSFLCFTIRLPEQSDSRKVDDNGYGVNLGGTVRGNENITFGKPKTISPYGFDAKGYYGSAINLIHSITISTRSGDELSRIERLNLLQYILNPWTRDQAWNDTVGAAMGQNQFFTVSDDFDTNRDRKMLEMRVAIPMYCLSGLFNYDKLLPSMLMSGLRIEIAWASPQTAFVRSVATPKCCDMTMAFSDNGVSNNARRFPEGYYGGSPIGAVLFPSPTPVPTDGGATPETVANKAIRLAKHDKANSELAIESYEVCDIYFQLKSIQLTDSVQRILNETSAVNGLEIVYTDINNTQAVQNASDTTGRCTGDFYMEVRHAASRALRAILVPRIQLANDTQVCDSFATIGTPFKRWHWRLGSLYFPHQPIKGRNSLEIIPQTYLYSLDAWGKVAGAPRSSITMDDYTSPYHKQTKNPISIHKTDGTGFSVKTADGFFPPAGEAGQARLYYDRLTTNAPIAVSLERSTLFNLSGIPINNSRVLSFHGEFDSAEGDDMPNFPSYGPLVFDCFLQYVRLARVFLNNVEVEQ